MPPKIQFHAHPQSPPCRAVHMTFSVIGKDFDYKYCDILNGANRSPDFVKLNPQHNIPFIVDGSLILNESRAITAYLIQKYGKDGGKQLLGSTPEEKAVINQRLNFDATVVWPRFLEALMPVAFAGKKEVPASSKDKLKEAFGWLEGFVSGTGFIAGTSHMTLADISIYANYSTLATTGKSMVDLDEYPALKSWADKMKTLIPNHEKSNQEGVDIFREFYKTKTGLID